MNNGKNNLIENYNSNKSYKNALNSDKKLPFLNLSSYRKIDNDNTERNDIYLKFNKYKNSIIQKNIIDKTRNEFNYDFLTERIKDKRLKNSQNL